MRLPVSVLVLSLVALACSEKKDFGGDGKTGSAAKNMPPVTESGNSAPIMSAPLPAPTPAPVAVSPAPSPAPTPAPVPAPAPKKPECDLNQKAVTSIKLLDNPTIQAEVADAKQTIRYEVSLVSCEDGTVLPLKDQNFQFDLNARLDQKDMGYEAFDAATNKSISTGKLSHKGGADLFGNVGPEWGRWENGSFSLPEGHAKIIMKLKLVKVFEPFGAEDEIETFFRIGDTKAVKVTLPFVY